MKGFNILRAGLNYSIYKTKKPHRITGLLREFMIAEEGIKNASQINEQLSFY